MMFLMALTAVGAYFFYSIKEHDDRNLSLQVIHR